MRISLPAVLVALALVAAACSGSTHASDSGPGTVTVLYAGSLVQVMHQVGPAFEEATGGTFHGEPAGSTALANSIKGKVRQGDVFISASRNANERLRGANNGGWESWYATFASAPLVIAYNPESSFAKDLTTKPWREVITEPGFHMGATDPVLDPKGKLAATALKRAGISQEAVEVFPETQLLTRLSSGNLDAGFFYSSEAEEAKLPTVPLDDVGALAAEYTVTVLNRAPNAAGGAAFVRYLLGDVGRKMLRQHGLHLREPTVTGAAAQVPPGLRDTLGLR